MDKFTRASFIGFFRRVVLLRHDFAFVCVLLRSGVGKFARLRGYVFVYNDLCRRIGYTAAGHVVPLIINGLSINRTKLFFSSRSRLEFFIFLRNYAFWRQLYFLLFLWACDTSTIIKFYCS